MTKERSLATFLKSSTRLDKKLLGDFISRPDQLELLSAFLRLFDYQGVSQFQGLFIFIPSKIISETHRGGYERDVGGLPASGRSAADCQNHGNICIDLFRFEAW